MIKNNKITKQDNVKKVIEDVLANAGLQEHINNFINSKEPRIVLNCHYDAIAELIEMIKKKLPASQVENEKKAYESVISREEFIEKILKKFKETEALKILIEAVESSNEKFEYEIKLEENLLILINRLDNLALYEASNVTSRYMKETFKGYIGNDIPDFLREWVGGEEVTIIPWNIFGDEEE